MIRGMLLLSIALMVGLANFAANAASPESKPKKELFARPNLVAWCIVPFDAKKRGPEERAAMLAKLGFTRFAYDYRAEHIPTFEAEIAALKKHKIELTAWWFPGSLNDEARGILELLKKHDLKIQLWVTGGGSATKSPEEQKKRVVAEAARIRPIAEAAGKIGCTVGLYNHGGWFGEPENQMAIIEELKLPNVGIVYNQHHGHDHLARFPELLKKILPHLYVLNLNGMNPDGERRGQKIIPLGQGELDLGLLKTIRDSGYDGPIGILGHTQDDAEQRLQDNLDGLDWLLPQLEGKPAEKKPVPRTKFPGMKKTEAAFLPSELETKQVAELVAEAQGSGDARQGIAVFSSAKFACISCHKIGAIGGSIGPELTDAGKRLNPEEIAEAILWPKKQVKPEFTAWRAILLDGRMLQGYQQAEKSNDKMLVLLDPGTREIHAIARDEIDEVKAIGSLMPEGLSQAMNPAQRRDVVRLLLELGKTPGLDAAVQSHGKPADFTFDRAPLDRASWPGWELPVNRERIYDYYLKQAIYFRDASHHGALLPQFPGLDGGKRGHWGNQNEEVWRDDRWNGVDVGNLLCGVFRSGKGITAKGVCVWLGGPEKLAVCFNPETLSYDAVWSGGFLKFSAVRHGFLDGLKPAGAVLPPTASLASPVDFKDKPITYRGFYRLGKQVAFAYRAGEVEILDAVILKEGKLERIVAPAEKHPLREALKGGPAQWPAEVTVAGKIGTAKPYAVDTIPLPGADNPWKALFFLGDHDFLPDGSALVCTMHGDVWRVSGLDAELKSVRWRRFASGLHQPLGLVVVDGQAHVLGRDQITRLHDLNGDGEADFYECVSNAQFTSPSGHDFICGLQRDSQGRFYTASSKQGLIRITPGRKEVETLATGFRNPDGLGLLPDGSLTVPSSEGDWVAASMIGLVNPAATSTSTSANIRIVPYFGYGGPRGKHPPALPLVYLPRTLDNSSGGQAVVPNDDRWGPLAGQLLHFSFGQGSHFLVLRDEVAGQVQGAVIPLAGEFRSGAHRGRFSPKDGQLYVSGMAGWGNYSPDDGCFHRVRYTGERVQLPKSFHVHENGVLIGFTAPVDKQQLAKLKNHFAQAWNYRYGPGYGSPEFAPSHPGVIGHDKLTIAGVHAIDDKTIFVELPELQPVNQLHLMLQVEAGRPQELFLTVHRLDGPYTKLPHYKPVKKEIAAHPITIDLAMLGKKEPNPWATQRPTEAILNVSAGANLTFSPRTLRVKRGANVKLTLTNPDVVPHNWVLMKPGKLQSIGEQANKLVADPAAVMRQYVPQSPDVLAYTDIVPAQARFSIYFSAPAERGVYPYLCSFPGHWMVMQGELIVE